jgi:3-oxoacyl-[acyl-carrier protein] reductase
MRYEGKQVVITGHTRGLGKMLADYFHDEGAEVRGLSRSEGCDVGDLEQVRKAMPRHVDICVNNAGVMQAGYAPMLSSARVEDMVRTNLLGTFYVSREAARAMRPGGRIVNIGSIAIPFEDPGTSMYTATKAGAYAMSGVLAKEYVPFGVTVNTIGLSALDTEMFREHSESTRKAILDRLPIKRMATFEDVRHVLDFFLSDDASYITGQIVFLGGAR